MSIHFGIIFLMSISGQIRQAIEASGLSGNALAKACGVSQPVISRFCAGNDIKLAAADKLADYFGLHLTTRGDVRKSDIPQKTTRKEAKKTAARKDVKKGKRGNGLG